MGAEFTLSKSSTRLTFEQEGDGVYQLSTAQNASKISSDSGVILIKGLKAGTYEIMETSAPDRYNPLTGTKTITIEHGKSYASKYKEYLYNI